ncbi:DUF397 domain-containing protein [Actinoallomurus purpureus]|nr:DUF397 domain-containing protein [Actinoallomurus purpureus]MCO6006898.1 DUF397 domain-containing protein [Actinoallomurus purpureus]
METQDGWRKSRHSGNSGNCVEVKVVDSESA